MDLSSRGKVHKDLKVTSLDYNVRKVKGVKKGVGSRGRCARFLQAAKETINRWVLHVDLASDTRSTVREILTSKNYWIIVVSGSLVCTIPLFLVSLILYIPEGLWFLRTAITCLIVGFWAIVSGFKEWHLHKQKEDQDEWFAGKEKEGKLPYDF